MVSAELLQQEESRRLQELRDYQILDTAPDPGYDTLTLLATLVCGVPFSTITFVDEKRNWFKSKVGLTLSEVPRELGFCAHTILQRDAFIVSDALKDRRFADNPYVTSSPHIRFYAGVPIMAESGRALGALCVLASSPLALSEPQIEALRVLAKRVTWLLEQEKARRERELKLVRAEKMASLGVMAAGIAHEINNPLAIVHGYTERIRALSEQSSTEQAAILALVNKIQTATQRISKIVKGLRAYAVDGEKESYQSIRLRDVLEDVVEFSQLKFKRSSIVVSLPEIPDSLVVECRPVALSQVIVNLLNNAFDAVEPLPEKWVRIEVREDDTHVLISVVDSGNGIPKELHDKIMAHFFTTKPADRGLGLGLSISKTIIEDHAGALAVDPDSPNTRFIVRIPRQRTQRGRIILVVDDEAEIVRIVADEFKRQGFSVLEASTGKQALEILTKQAVDAILSDVMMPNGNGIQLFDDVKVSFAGKIPFFVMTGYMDPKVQSLLDKGARACFAKPFDVRSVIETVKKHTAHSA